MGNTGKVSATEYLQTANDSLLTIVQIETKEALENVWHVTIHRKLKKADNIRLRKSQRSPVSTSCSLAPGI